MTSPADLDGDGKVSEHELMIYERRLRAQRRMATAALVAVVGFTGLLMTPLLLNTSIKTSEVLHVRHFRLP